MQFQQIVLMTIHNFLLSYTLRRWNWFRSNKFAHIITYSKLFNFFLVWKIISIFSTETVHSFHFFSWLNDYLLLRIELKSFSGFVTFVCHNRKSQNEMSNRLHTYSVIFVAGWNIQIITFFRLNIWTKYVEVYVVLGKCNRSFAFARIGSIRVECRTYCSETF